ncbi:MAG: ribonuclease E/G [Shimia sp.]
MKGRLIALDHVAGREAAALMVDGRLEDLLIDGPDLARIGAVFRARVARPLKGQGGLIVAWPGGEAFLRRAKGLAPREELFVQVTGFAEPGKAQPVTDRLLFKSRYAIVTPGAPGLNVSRAIKDDDRREALTALAIGAMDGCGHGLILRSAAEGADDADIEEDVLAMRDAAEAALSATALGPVRAGDGPHLSAWREWGGAQVDTAAGSFEAHGILDAIDGLGPRVDLGPHHMWIEPTRALTAVDVNTGADLSAAAALKANLAAVGDLMRGLRLRGIGGQVTVDFAPLLKRDRRRIETALRAAARGCPVETEVIGWTPLGHMEIKRKRERRPLAELLPNGLS